ncbi:MAG: SMC-Scp complex subunit ScpB [Krumholzibacteria bacterium]|nr:SMC-Scp complex subunit ScpB [Candidatus Krumholzibacteria bacterium]
MKRDLEALLFATDAPLTAARLRKIFPEAEPKDLREAVAELQQEYDRDGHAFTVVEFGGGWQIATRPDYSPVVEQLLQSRRFARLSKAGLEVLAIVAYRQPITRLEIDEIRGVNSSGAIATLTERSLITVVGRSQTVGNPLLYGTTREFLNHLGLKGLGQLPALPAMESIIDDREQLKAFASRLGRDVSDDELDGFLATDGEDGTGDDAEVIADPLDTEGPADADGSAPPDDGADDGDDDPEDAEDAGSHART